MKKSTILALIIGIITVIAGIFICICSLLGAKLSNEALFLLESSPDGNIVYTYDLTGQSIGAVSIDLSKDIQVNIRSGESDRIEFINFPAGTYNTGISTRILSINDDLNLLAMPGLGNDSNFSGLRNLLYNLVFANKEKSINVYISPKSQINSLSVKTPSSISVTDLTCRTDLTLRSEGSGITMSDCAISSFVTLEGAWATVGTSNVRKLEITSTNGNISIIRSSITNCTASALIGDIIAELTCEPTQVALSAKCSSGVVMLDEEVLGASLEQPVLSPVQTFDLTAKRGNITILSDT